MITEFLQKFGFRHKPDWVKEWFQITIFIMSEGTAQGQPRPLKVCKETMSWTTDKNDPWAVSEASSVQLRVREILKYGYGTTQTDGVNVKFAPNTIYKVTWKRIE